VNQHGVGSIALNTVEAINLLSMMNTSMYIGHARVLTVFWGRINGQGYIKYLDPDG
jgi:hypothetical protein